MDSHGQVLLTWHINILGSLQILNHGCSSIDFSLLVCWYNWRPISNFSGRLSIIFEFCVTITAHEQCNVPRLVPWLVTSRRNRQIPKLFSSRKHQFSIPSDAFSYHPVRSLELLGTQILKNSSSPCIVIIVIKFQANWLILTTSVSSPRKFSNPTMFGRTEK
jgi:hypothetical protein